MNNAAIDRELPVNYNDKNGGIVNQKRFYVFIIMILTVILIIFIISGITVSRRYRELSRKYTALSEKYSEKQSDLITDTEIEYFKRKGIEDPLRQLKDDLMNRDELIETSGQLGGTMGFHDRDAVNILNRYWVYAPFDDGHVQGYMILEYQFKGDSVLWNVIESKTDI
ncbi:MAG: hypothetical protein SVK54_08370 [candidate division WOR-3 bacterium]|nr:hypothetical protein [candidate division WOR-3 bacterium]